MPAGEPLSTLLSRVLVAHTIELDNEFERRFAETGEKTRVASVVMWSNFLRFVGDGIAVRDLPEATGLPKNRLLSKVGGMERWRYVFVTSDPSGEPPARRRDGYGSARGLRSDLFVRATPAGRAAGAIWARLLDEVDERWADRFGDDAVRELKASLRSIVERVDVELPEYVPIVAATDGMVAGFSARAGRTEVTGRLSSLLSQVLLAYTLDFERASPLSLPLSANVVRVLDEAGVPVSELPRRGGVSKEAVSIALRYLGKTGYAEVAERTTHVSLTAQGADAKRGLPGLHAAVEDGWRSWFGDANVDRLRAALERVLREPARLAAGLEPHPGGWRAGKPYLERTQALLADPIGALPHYPMVLHRGGWPDAS